MAVTPLHLIQMWFPTLSIIKCFEANFQRLFLVQNKKHFYSNKALCLRSGEEQLQMLKLSWINKILPSKKAP